MRHRVDHQVDARDCRRHRFSTIEIHEGGAADAVTAAHAPDDAPACVLERPHDGTAEDAAAPITSTERSPSPDMRYSASLG